MVNPYEIEKVADCIQNALTMDKAEAEIRMVSLRNREQKNDLNFLLNTFLKEMGSYDIQGRRAFKNNIFVFKNKIWPGYFQFQAYILYQKKATDVYYIFVMKLHSLSINISDIFLCALSDKKLFFHLHNISQNLLK